MNPPASNFRAIMLVICVILLAGVGILMLASTGAFATDGTAEGMGALKKQGIFIGLGIILCFGIARFDYHYFEKGFYLIAAGALVLLVLCYVPHVGVERNGESRWVNMRLIGMGFVQIQPSELGKFAVVLFLAWWYSRHPLRVGEFWKGFVQPWCILAVPILLIGGERDLGTAALVVAFSLLVMFMVGVRLLYLVGVATAGLVGLGLAVRLIPERMDRITAFMNLEAHRQGEGLQQWRAQIALGSGGLGGRGYGNGVEKLFYMPYAHTDFIFPMIGEEFGLAGSLVVILIFIGLVTCGLLIAGSARDAFGRILGAGIVALIACQAIVNLGVTTALLPNKGLPLPFISYGGSNLLVFFVMIGILINIHSQGLSQEKRRSGKGLGMTIITPRL